jgi:putative DNA primase/helicase
MKNNNKLPISACRTLITTYIDNFFADLDLGYSNHALLRCDTAIGKSSRARAAISPWIVKRKRLGLPHKIFFAVPHHKLSEETVADFQAKGINAIVYRGREAINPATQKPMCANLEAVKEVQSLGGDVLKSVCGTLKGAHCPFRVGCAYMDQSAEVKKADVVIASHQLLFSPAGLGDIDEYALVVIDETFYANGLTQPCKLDVDTMMSELRAYPIMNDTAAYMQLQIATQELQGYFHTLDDGYITKAHSLPKLPYDDCSRHEWKRKISLQISPGMTSTDIRAVAAKDVVAINSEIRQLATMWKVLSKLHNPINREVLDSRLRLEKGKPNDRGYYTTTLHMNFLKSFDERILEKPILYLDATPVLDIAKVFMPNLEVLGDICAETPHMKVTQVRGGFGSTTLILNGKDGPKQIKTKTNRVEQFKKILAELPGKKLVITYEGYKQNFQGLVDVEVAHFNATRGVNTYSTVDHLLIIGRPFAPDYEVRAQAECYFGHILPPEKPTDRDVNVDVQGGIKPLKVKDYQNKYLSDIKRLITDAEIIQDIGRGRGVNRTESNPLNVIVFADVELPFAISDVVDFNDFRKSRLDMMAKENAFVLSPQDAARLYPHIFASEDIAHHEILSEITEQTAEFHKEIYMEKCVLLPLFRQKYLLHNHTSIAYQYAGAGAKPRYALVRDTAQFKSIIEQFGALKTFEKLHDTEKQRYIDEINTLGEVGIMSNGEYHLTRFNWTYHDGEAIPGRNQIKTHYVGRRLVKGTGEYTWDEMKDLLRSEWLEGTKQKTKRHLWSAAFYGEGATRATANARAANVLIFDFDDGVTTDSLLRRAFPYRMVCVNTYSSSAAKLKWRAYVPLTRYVTPDAYRYIVEHVVSLLQAAGGDMDDSSAAVAQAFYAPCQPGQDQHFAFFHAYDDPIEDPILDPIEFIDSIPEEKKQFLLSSPTTIAAKTSGDPTTKIQSWIDECQHKQNFENGFDERQRFAGRIKRYFELGHITRYEGDQLFDDMARHFVSTSGKKDYKAYLNEMTWVWKR